MYQSCNKNIIYKLERQLMQLYPRAILLLFFIGTVTHVIAQINKKNVEINSRVDKQLIENRFPTNVAPVIGAWFPDAACG